MIKRIILLNIVVLCLASQGFAQDGNFNNLTVSQITVAGGASQYSGWGTNSNKALDPRPNSIDREAFVINYHNGLTFSAHSEYGGIRFYNQGYPIGPLEPSTGATMVMSITNNSVGIGTTNPTEKLSVKGKIRAQEIKVEADNWPDYVFTKAYQIPSLKETEDYIKENGHLSGIPSATEVKANGIELGAMNAKLLEKIEELTLHLIQKEKELADEHLINKNQEERLKRLESVITGNEVRSRKKIR